METKLVHPLWPDRSPHDCQRFGVLLYGWQEDNIDPYTAPYNKWLLEIDPDKFKQLLLGGEGVSTGLRRVDETD